MRWCVRGGASAGVVPRYARVRSGRTLRFAHAAGDTGRRGPEFRFAGDLLPRYQSELEPLQTHRFPLDAIEDAFACAADKKSGSIKVTVTP